MIWSFLVGCPKAAPVSAAPPAPPPTPPPPVALVAHERADSWCSEHTLIAGDEVPPGLEPGPCPEEGTLAVCALPDGWIHRVLAVGPADHILLALTELERGCREGEGRITVTELPLVRVACSNPVHHGCIALEVIRATDTFAEDLDARCGNAGGLVVPACPDPPDRFECPALLGAGLQMIALLYPQPGDTAEDLAARCPFGG
jgi:hypothetical protein